MIKRLLAIASLALVPVAAFSGYANADLGNASGGLDFHYPSELEKSRASLVEGGQIKLQARFIWSGPAGASIGGGEHAIVAFTQGANQSYVNAAQQPLWTHGVGAFVHPQGLHLELWFRNDDNHNGTISDDTTKANVWAQSPNNCRNEVNGAGPTGLNCLAATTNSSGYLWPYAFSLKKGVGYWVRTTLTKQPSNPRATLFAELFEETASGAVLRQQGLVEFDPGFYFPNIFESLKGTLARTGGSGETIHYDAFDYGF